MTPNQLETITLFEKELLDLPKRNNRPHAEHTEEAKN